MEQNRSYKISIESIRNKVKNYKPYDLYFEKKRIAEDIYTYFYDFGYGVDIVDIYKEIELYLKDNGFGADIKAVNILNTYLNQFYIFQYEFYLSFVVEQTIKDLGVYGFTENLIKSLIDAKLKEHYKQYKNKKDSDNIFALIIKTIILNSYDYDLNTFNTFSIESIYRDIGEDIFNLLPNGYESIKKYIDKNHHNTSNFEGLFSKYKIKRIKDNIKQTIRYLKYRDFIIHNEISKNYMVKPELLRFNLYRFEDDRLLNIAEIIISYLKFSPDTPLSEVLSKINDIIQIYDAEPLTFNKTADIEIYVKNNQNNTINIRLDEKSPPLKNLQIVSNSIDRATFEKSIIVQNEDGKEIKISINDIYYIETDEGYIVNLEHIEKSKNLSSKPILNSPNKENKTIQIDPVLIDYIKTLNIKDMKFNSDNRIEFQSNKDFSMLEKLYPRYVSIF